MENTEKKTALKGSDKYRMIKIIQYSKLLYCTKTNNSQRKNSFSAVNLSANIVLKRHIK